MPTATPLDDSRAMAVTSAMQKAMTMEMADTYSVVNAPCRIRKPIFWRMNGRLSWKVVMNRPSSRNSSTNVTAICSVLGTRPSSM